MKFRIETPITEPHQPFGQFFFTDEPIQKRLREVHLDAGARFHAPPNLRWWVNSSRLNCQADLRRCRYLVQRLFVRVFVTPLFTGGPLLAEKLTLPVYHQTVLLFKGWILS